MKIKKESLANLLLMMIGIFCQINPLLSRGMMIIYLGFCLFLYILILGIEKIKLGIGFYWYFFFVAFCLFSLTYTVNNINPDFVYIRIITYLVLLFLVIPFMRKEDNIKKVIKGFFWGGLLGISYVFIKQYNLIGVRRLGGGLYGSCVEFGMVGNLAMMSFLLINKNNRKHKIINILVFTYLTLAIALSGTRKAMLMILLMLLFMQLFDKRKTLPRRIIVLSLLAMTSLITLYVLLNNEYLYKFIGNRIESGFNSVVGKEEDESLEERSTFKNLAIQIFKERPIFGWGMHGFAMKNYYAHNKARYFLLYSHDGFLEILSCYGVIGFVLFYWIFVYIFVNYKKLLYSDVSIFLFSYMIIILLMELYDIAFFSCSFVILIGACSNLIRERRKNEKNNQVVFKTNS